MSKKVTVTYSITYDLTQGEIAQEYLESLGDYTDTSSDRRWFAIDRFIGFDNLKLFDQAATLTVTESE